MFVHLLFSFLGYLEVRVLGKRPERFLNLALANGIYFWNVRWTGEGLRLNMGIWAFRRIRPIARRSRCSVRIVSKRGLPFFLRRAMARRVLAGGVVVVFLILYVLTSFVWFIEIRGLRSVSMQRVLAAMERHGLYPGAYKGSLDFNEIATRLTSEVKEIGWAGIYSRGTKVIVEVVERATLAGEKVPDERPGDILAGKDGVVTSVLVLMGEGMVRPGDTVRKGQVLIRGSLGGTSSQEGEDGAGHGAGQGVAVRARGVVKARVWYDVYVEIPLQTEVAERTGAVWTRRVLRIGGKGLVIQGRGAVPFDDYQVEEVVVRPKEWRRTVIPVELITQRYYDVRRRQEKISEVEAVKRAEAEARRGILRQVPVSARIEREEIRVVQRTKTLVGLRLSVETEEDIGVFGRR